MKLATKIIITALFSMFITGCAVNPEPVVMRPDGRPQLATAISRQMDRNIQQLIQALMSLGPNINLDEAIEVAHDAYVYPLYLAREWNLTWPPMVHNTLRNANVRTKGLCTDWAAAMLEHMRRKNLRSFDLYWAVAYRGDAWREHSTLLVTAKGQPFDTGIILDPWRNSSKLYWLRHVEDPAYEWKYHAGPFGPLPKRGGPVQRIY